MSLKKRITETHIDQVNAMMWQEAELKYGSKFKVPTEKVYAMSTKLRALYCLQGWDGKGSPVAHLVFYNIPEDIIADVVAEYCGVDLDVEDVQSELKTEKRADKWDAFLRWSKSHLFEQFTTEELTELSGFSYPTTLKYLQTSPSFRKIKKGLWEVRDPKADKENDKAS